MGEFIINGKRALWGTVTVSGSKNAALPVIFSTLLVGGVSRIRNIPDILDTKVALNLVRSFGAEIRREGDLTLIDTSSLEYHTPDPRLVRQLRASTYLIGSCLSRFGIAELSEYGGCSFSPRPIDMHISEAVALGASREGDILYARDGLFGAEISFGLPSVGATVNFLLMASGARGVSVLHGAAREPHILALIDFLRSAGAEIDIDGSDITVRGASLSDGEITLGGDPIEAGTYIAASVATGGSIRVLGASTSELEPFLTILKDGGVTVNSSIGISATGRLTERVEVCAKPYPGFPTDLQPILAPLLALGAGGTIEDSVWRGRFGYLVELAALGVYSRRVGERYEIFPSELSGARAVAPDLRGGAGALIAALAAEGESVIDNAEVILRGYEGITEKLSRVGAEIIYKNNT